jgi:pimeloyl-ACP methyl ester carboxylesterase
MRVLPSALAFLSMGLFVQNGLAAEQLPRRAQAPLEQFGNADLELGMVQDARGQRLRTLITIPRAKGKLAAVFVAGWLSCDSTEVRPNAKDGVSRLLRQLIEESGAVVMRLDKQGVGDSEGNCRETDFNTELSGYRAAFAALKAHARVDNARIVMLGISNGGGFAPLVAQKSTGAGRAAGSARTAAESVSSGAPGTTVAGYVSIGGWSKTWFEHMIELERRRLAFEGRPAGAINAEMKPLAQLHASYLLEGRTPAEVFAAHPNLKSVWYDEPAHQYGRPAAFYHQLQSLDLAAAWSNVAAPALVVWGEYDWIMSRDDQTLIVDLVNARSPGRARLLAVPGMDHSFSTHPDAKTAYARMGAGNYPDTAAAEILRFIREVTR